jgi:hypothetical protein
MGALVEEFGDGMWTATWAWSHPDHGLSVCPLGIVQAYRDGCIDKFIDSQNSPAVKSLSLALFGKTIPQETLTLLHGPLSPKEAADATIRTDWKKYSRNERELEAIVDLGKYTIVALSSHAVKMAAYAERVVPRLELQKLKESWTADLTGEPAFIIAFLILLNTKNGVTYSKEDRSRLNLSRQKQGKPPLRDFQITKINLAQHAERQGILGSAAREKCRQHYVRGHFKVRQTGVYWWSPFVRGQSADATPRERYIVR